MRFIPMKQKKAPAVYAGIPSKCSHISAFPKHERRKTSFFSD